jgi:membrane protein
MTFPIINIFVNSLQRFNEDKCWNSAIIISYFALLSAVPLAALFAFVTAKFLGTSELAFRSLNIFSEEFFARLDPALIEKIQVVSKNVTNLGWFGLLGSLIAGSFLFSNLIHTINAIFKADYHKSFFYNRLIEYLVMFTMAIILVLSLSITAAWTAIHRSMRESAFVANHVNPGFLSLVDNFLIQYLIPLALSFLVIFSIYKFIPEVKVYTRAAAIAAIISAVLWEIFKRIFVFYIAHFSAVGVVLSKFLQGTLTSIIFFLLWLSFSLMILLWGAELAAVLNERFHAKKIQQK